MDGQRSTDRNAALQRILAWSGQDFGGFFNPQSKDVPWITRYVPVRQVPLQREQENCDTGSERRILRTSLGWLLLFRKKMQNTTKD